MNRGRLQLLALIVSLAFNLGIVGSIVARSTMNARGSGMPPAEPAECNTSPLMLQSGLLTELKPLRQEQASMTRNLADMITGKDPDLVKIEQCLDRLSATGRVIQGRVVRAVLERKEELPETERPDFCIQVHRSLCDSWTREGIQASCCPEPTSEQNK